MRGSASSVLQLWEETIPEFAKMWLNEEYPGFEGKWWTLPPRKILPKPYGKGHSAMWYAAGNTSSYEMAARKGLGVLGCVRCRSSISGRPLPARYGRSSTPSFHTC